LTGTVIRISQPSIPDLRQKVDRILQSVWAPPDAPVKNPDDTVLIAAEREFRRLQRFEHYLNRGRGRAEHRAAFLATERELDRLSPRWNALYELIYSTPAAGLVGAAVKLRLLTDDAIGLSESCSDEAEGEALRDILRVVQRELKAQQQKQWCDLPLRGARRPFSSGSGTFQAWPP
jgi:hypothetical protein